MNSNELISPSLFFFTAKRRVYFELLIIRHILSNAYGFNWVCSSHSNVAHFDTSELTLCNSTKHFPYLSFLYFTAIRRVYLGLFFYWTTIWQYGHVGTSMKDQNHHSQCHSISTPQYVIFNNQQSSITNSNNYSNINMVTSAILNACSLHICDLINVFLIF